MHGPILWEDELDDLMQLIGPRFARLEARNCAKEYIRGLLLPTRRKNGWQLAAATENTTPYQFQQFLYRSPWNPNVLLDDLGTYVINHLGDNSAVLVIDELSFIKKGDQSAGVHYQTCSTSHLRKNCQIGLFLIYAATHGAAFIDRQLFIPKEWIDDRTRRQRVGLPESMTFTTKHMYAQFMIKQAIDRGVPFRWISGNSFFGHDYAFRFWIEAIPYGYVFPALDTETVFLNWNQYSVADILLQLQKKPRTWADKWMRLGKQGAEDLATMYEWILMPLTSPKIESWKRGLLIRRRIGSPTHLKAYICFGPTGTKVTDLVRVIERMELATSCLSEAKEKVGLDRYHVRTWMGWYRHMTMACLAYALLASARSKQSKATHIVHTV